MTADSKAPLLVLGAGSWGTALAARAAAAGTRVRLWGRDPTLIADLRASGTNQRYLPGIDLPDGIEPVASLAEAFSGIQDILIAAPTAAFAELLNQIKGHVEAPRVAWACKGLERDTGALLSTVIANQLGPETPAAVVSGPTFALEVASGLPTAVVIAGNEPGFVESLSLRLHQPCFRVYRSDDLAGVQVGGAAKNVLAIAAGISDGLGFGANARAALISRGLAEMVRLASRLDGRRETLMGLAGLGDLVLTCTDDQSRNRRYGLALGRGLDAEAALAATGKVVEGALACRDFDVLATALKIELPIMARVNQVVWHGQTPKAAVEELLSRAASVE